MQRLTWVIHAVFFLSGFAAILYQLVWQRALFRMYGTNTESVAIVVTAFMLGLGLGSLAGGWVSKIAGRPLPLVFAGVELGIAAYGFCSMSLFEWAGTFTAGASGTGLGLIALLLVLVPTLLMGSTLPILVAYSVPQSGNVGRSVGNLYFLNTLGSAAGCFAAALLILGALGQASTVRLAAGVNAFVALIVLAAFARLKPAA
jgi:predicted membrane-bound spermidine synthase